MEGLSYYLTEGRTERRKEGWQKRRKEEGGGRGCVSRVLGEEDIASFTLSLTTGPEKNSSIPDVEAGKHLSGQLFQPLISQSRKLRLDTSGVGHASSCSHTGSWWQGWDQIPAFLVLSPVLFLMLLIPDR